MDFTPSQSILLISLKMFPTSGTMKRISSTHTVTISKRVKAAAMEWLIRKLPIFIEVRNSMSGFPIKESTAAIMILVSTELKYQAKNSTMEETAAMIIYLASLFINGIILLLFTLKSSKSFFTFVTNNLN